MAIMPDVKLTVNVVFWCFDKYFNFFTIDDASEIKGIVEQLTAENLGLT